MSEQITFELDGSPANPENRNAFQVDLNFDKDNPIVNQYVTTNDFTFVNEDHDRIQAHILKGRNGTGPGVAMGMPFMIRAQDGSQAETLYNGMLNFRRATYTKVRSKVATLEKKGIDWLNEVADSFTFERMFKETGEITEDDFTFCPYIINTVPDYKEAAIAALTATFVAAELTDAVNKLSQLATSLTNVFEATAIVRLVLEILYLTALIVSLVQLIKDMILFLIQPVKYHAGMKIKTLFEKGCARLGLTFKSTIFDTGSEYENLCVIPDKFTQPANPSEPRIFNFTQPEKMEQVGYYKGTFGQFVRDMKIVFAGKITFIQNNSTGNIELHFEREDKVIATPVYNLPGIYSPDIYDQSYSFNLDDFIANYYMTYQVDVTDRNTIQQYKGTAYQAFVQSSIQGNDDYKLSSGLKEINIPFAHAARKETLTVPEKICNALVSAFGTLVNGIISAINGMISAVNALVSSLNKIKTALNVIGINVSWTIKPIPSIPPSNLGSLISNRIGMMMIETDSFTVPKLVILDIANNAVNTKISAISREYLSAQKLYHLFHFVRSYIPWAGKPTGNQYMIKPFENVPFTFKDLLLVLAGKGFGKDSKGNDIWIPSLKWNPEKQTASMVVWFPYLILKNLELKEIIPDGK